MKITKSQLKQIIKEELEEGGYAGHHIKEEGPEVDIRDAIQMLEAEEDPTGTLAHVINRLYEALEKPPLGDPSKVIASDPDPSGVNPPQEVYQWQDDEFEAHNRAWKNFMKRQDAERK